MNVPPPADLWIPAYVGVGSNLEDPVRQVRTAFSHLAALPGTRLIATSRLYRNPPLGDIPQPDFINAAAGLLTRLAPHELLDALKEIELRQGRDRSAPRWGPRTVDLDLLVYGSERLSEGRLTLPHPGIAERNFVLFPLHDIAPGLNVPGVGLVADLAAAADDSTLVPVD